MVSGCFGIFSSSRNIQEEDKVSPKEARFDEVPPRLATQLLKDANRLSGRTSELCNYLQQKKVPCSFDLSQLSHEVELISLPKPVGVQGKSVQDMRAAWGYIENGGAQDFRLLVSNEINRVFQDVFENRNGINFEKRMPFDFVENLYNSYLCSKSNPDFWMFSSFEQFSSVLEKKYSVCNVMLREEIRFFMRKNVFCSSVVLGSGSENGVYQLENRNLVPYLIRDMKYLDSNGNRNLKNVVQEFWIDASVADEVKKIKREGYLDQSHLLFHNSGSAALDGIARSEAILSAYNAVKTNQKVLTGEFVSYLDENGVSQSGGSSGLRDVYTLRRSDLSSNAYSYIRWFNEFPITFGINVNSQRMFNEERGVSIYSYDNDRKGDGTVVGPVVSLKNIEVISAPKANEAEVLAWIATNCPHVRFISKEAASIFREESRTF